MAAAARRAWQGEASGSEQTLNGRTSCGDDAAPKGCAMHAGTDGAALRCMFWVPEGEKRPSDALVELHPVAIRGTSVPVYPLTSGANRAERGARPPSGGLGVCRKAAVGLDAKRPWKRVCSVLPWTARPFDISGTFSVPLLRRATRHGLLACPELSCPPAAPFEARVQAHCPVQS